MSHSRRQTFHFVLEGLNAFACSYYFNYLLFLLRDQFGFGNRENLLVGALHGLVFTAGSWWGGRFAQRRGYYTALRIGCGGMALALALGSLLDSVAGQLAMMAGWTLGMCFTWAPLEALVSEGESAARLPRRIGIYNVVWAGGSALAYFCGGAIFETFGAASLYWLPVLLHATQIALVQRLARCRAVEPTPPASAAAPPPHHPEEVAFRQPVKPQTFLRMAWLANPFAYVAINTVVTLIPGLAREFHLSTTEAGLFCSLWLFARLGAFFLLWQWAGWHYRFRWLLLAFVALVASFATIQLGQRLWLVAVAQIVFGLAVGLIYCSSLFYSMDVGETKGEHGGFHESALGVGICVGPALGAGTLHFLPQYPNSGALAVTLALLGGLVGLVVLRLRRSGK
jgi:predicted MFS family arabinose efflux permease